MANATLNPTGRGKLITAPSQPRALGDLALSVSLGLEFPHTCVYLCLPFVFQRLTWRCFPIWPWPHKYLLLGIGEDRVSQLNRCFRPLSGDSPITIPCQALSRRSRCRASVCQLPLVRTVAVSSCSLPRAVQVTVEPPRRYLARSIGVVLEPMPGIVTNLRYVRAVVLEDVVVAGVQNIRPRRDGGCGAPAWNLDVTGDTGI